ncbi:MAG: dimethyl sulfoxide reductase anchor subunit [Deltaproteobacteria bacterium]|nr:dimethyl sulfoxide reductase anchor subunit [Deltaproteobacteria bacterium]
MARTEPFQIRIADLRERYRPQREWAEGRGLLLILAHFFTGAGAGAWLFAVPLGSDTGLVAGFFLAVLGAVGHLFFLGRPERFWRMATRMGSSWISRGLVGLSLFLVTAFLYLALLFLAAHTTTLGSILLALSMLGALWTIIYKGFVWASSKGIPLWNTPLVPALYIAYALRGGAAVLILLAGLGIQLGAWEPLEPIKLWLAVSTAVLVLIYLEVMRGSGMTALRSVNLLLFGKVALPFYLGAVLLGLIVPIGIGSFAYLDHIPAGLLALVGLLSLLGDLSIIYCIARAGLYRPLPT